MGLKVVCCGAGRGSVFTGHETKAQGKRILCLFCEQVVGKTSVIVLEWNFA